MESEAIFQENQSQNFFLFSRVPAAAGQAPGRWLAGSAGLTPPPWAAPRTDGRSRGGTIRSQQILVFCIIPI